MPMKHKVSFILFNIVILAFLTSCGPSEEKLAEVNTKLQALENARTVAEETFGDLIDSSYKDELDKLSIAADDIAALEYTKMKDSKIEEIIPSIESLTDDYEAIEADLLEIAEKEKAEAEEEGRYINIQGYVTNKTGKTINSIILRDDSQNKESDDLLISNVELGNNETLMGIVFEVYIPTDVWSIIITTSDDSTYVAQVQDLEDRSMFGMTFGEIAEDGTFTVTIGDYVSEAKETERANTSSSESSSVNAEEEASSNEASSESSN